MRRPVSIFGTLSNAFEFAMRAATLSNYRYRVWFEVDKFGGAWKAQRIYPPQRVAHE